jgi:periplasmic protein TonB
MARTEFGGSQSGGDRLSREAIPANSGFKPDLEAIDMRLNEIEEETELPETAGNRSNEQRSQTVPELSNGPRELLSESTDLNALMAAILGEGAREGVPLERVEQSHPVERPDDAPDAMVPWRQELETLLAEDPRRELATAPRTPAPPVAAPAATGRFSALMHSSAVVRRWPMSRVSLLPVIALAGMTLGVLAWQSANSDRAVLSTPSPAVAVATAAEPTSATVPGSGVPPAIISTGAAIGSPATARGAAQAPPAGRPRISSATSSNNATVRSAPAPPAEAREPAPAPTQRETSPSAPTPLESAPAPDAARFPEPPPGRTETVKPPQPTATVASSVTESMTTSTPSAASPAAPITVGGAVPGGARPEPPAVAPSVAVQRTEPRLLRRAIPEYPSQLRRARVGGIVTVTITVDAQGRVVNVRSIDGPNILRQFAEAAAKRWRYEPATMNGTPLESSVNVTFNFDPSDAAQLSR